MGRGQGGGGSRTPRTCEQFELLIHLCVTASPRRCAEQRVWPANGEVATEIQRWIPSGRTHAFLWATLQPGVPKPPKRGRARPSCPGCCRPAARTERLCCKAIRYTGQHGQAAWTRSCCLVSHRAREAHGEKRKVSTVPGGANTCCQRADPAAQH